MRHDGETWVELGGVRQWVRIAGWTCNTVPLIVLHGGPGGHHWVFERTAGTRLETERTVVYHEQRGCGRSEAPADSAAYSIPILVEDIVQLMTWLNVPCVDLLGYSFGGGLALKVAQVRPDLIRRVIAQAPVLDVWHSEIVEYQLAEFKKLTSASESAMPNRRVCESSAEELEQIWAMAGESLVNRFLFQNAAHGAQNRQWWAESGLINTGEMQAALACSPHHEAIDRTIKIPTLLLMGLHDRNVPLSSVRRLMNNVEDVRLILFENSAHFPDIEEVDAYVRVVLDFLSAVTS